ncbi:hypothetical protein SAMN04490244_10487 [Tranquillimonas rosea]|uniref:Copper(I)-binding protein n=1 Tax=Tranquillimonas rosea TaxID=641238 RepID=A0A1H9TC52_9RHOB|nr:hypothetical protein [Tranquillimonas rosea]SER94698.1 hypothetical protein SAMN04490244_10487 [Tranquillimonas rosea]
MRPTPLALAALLAAAPVAAQEFDDAYEVIGTLELTLGGEDHTLYALNDTERDRAYVTAQDSAGFTIVTISAVAEDDGRPARPFATLLATLEDGAVADGTVSVDWRTEDRVLMANSDSGAPADVTDFSRGDDGAITLSFSGEMQPMESGDDMDASPIEGGTPVAVEGTFTGTLPQ